MLHRWMIWAACLCCHAAIGLDCSAAPDIFKPLDLDAARLAAKQSGKLLIVDFTAPWCMPCKRMDEQTWSNPNLAAWIGDHAIAIQINVDENHQLAFNHHVRSMPTVLVFKGNDEFDRVIGFQSADEISTWLGGLLEGRSRRDVLIELAKKRPDVHGRVNVQLRMGLASDLVDANLDELATEEFVWLWTTSSKYDVSGSALSWTRERDLKTLVARYDPAEEAFTRIRDESETALALAENPSVRTEWLILNDILEQEDRTLEWFDLIKMDFSSDFMILQIGYRLENLLKDRKRWRDLAWLYLDPVRNLDRLFERFGIMKDRELRADRKGMAPEYIPILVSGFLQDVAQMYMALLAADRDEDASVIAKRALARYDDPAHLKVELVQWALIGGEPRPEQLQWAVEAGEAGQATQGLIKKLNKALNER